MGNSVMCGEAVKFHTVLITTIMRNIQQQHPSGIMYMQNILQSAPHTMTYHYWIGTIIFCHSIDEKTKAKEGQETCPRSYNSDETQNSLDANLLITMMPCFLRKDKQRQLCFCNPHNKAMRTTDGVPAVPDIHLGQPCHLKPFPITQIETKFGQLFG